MKTAIVTGGGSGIGKAVSMELANEEYQVIVGDIQIEKANKVVAEITENGGRALALFVDIANEQSICQMIDKTVAWTGTIDLLVNNAGVNFQYSVEDCPSDEFDRCITINIKGHYLCSKFAIPYLRKEQGASIINIASTHASRTQPHFFPYNASKGGLISMTKSMAIDLSKDGIRVNAICPGFIETEMMNPAQYQEGSAYRNKVLPYHPVGRLGHPMDIAYAVSFLASEKASFINGVELIIDGGRNALTYTLE